MAKPNNKSPLVLAQGTAQRFVVRAGSHELGDWAAVSGLEVKWGIADHRVGDSDQYFKFAMVQKYEPIKLRRALDPEGSKLVQQWLDDIQRLGAMPEDGAVDIVDSATGQVLLTWTLKAMFPIRWKVTDFEASNAKPYVETLEVVHSGLLTGAYRAQA
jgi:phage tail-like protein